MLNVPIASGRRAALVVTSNDLCRCSSGTGGDTSGATGAGPGLGGLPDRRDGRFLHV